MHDSSPLEIEVSADDLLHEVYDFCFDEILLDALGEVRVAKFSDNIGVVFSGKYIVDIEYVGYVFEFFEDVDFCVEEGAVDLILEKFKINDLDSHRLV